MEHNPNGSEGVVAQVRAMMIATLSYVRARLELAGVESREAFDQIGGAVLIGIAAVTLGLVGYLLLCLAIVFGLSRFFASSNGWIWIAGTMGTAHLIGAWAMLRAARGWVKRPMFAATLEEFRKDESWLKSTAARPR